MRWRDSEKLKKDLQSIKHSLCSKSTQGMINPNGGQNHALTKTNPNSNEA